MIGISLNAYSKEDGLRVKVRFYWTEIRNDLHYDDA